MNFTQNFQCEGIKIYKNNIRIEELTMKNYMKLI